ncbi:hypothetical protein [Nonomuraea candida]|uniref:hypothetical protein n=1 Tax=Nonomuraea candida TaxID=359159 RepID=UPI0005BBFAEB|nr:hypothetical protein [Nonomuraea candida]
MNELKNLARVRDEDLAGRASGPGARALLAAITAEPIPGTASAAITAEPLPGTASAALTADPVAGAASAGAAGAAVAGGRLRGLLGRLVPGNRAVRLAVGAVAALGLATAIVIGPSLLGERGVTPSYANAAIDIRLRGDSYVAVIKDPFADYAKYTEGFKAVGLDVNLTLVPASPSQVGELTGIRISGMPASNGRSIESGTEPAGCTLGQAGCAMSLTVPRDWTGWASVRLGRAAEPGEKYQNWRSATSRGEMLEGFRADEKTVGEVLAEVRRRDLSAVFQVIEPAPGRQGYGLRKEQRPDEVGDDWIVWEAQSEQAGVVRLLVTEERLPKNPVYGGPKPADPAE